MDYIEELRVEYPNIMLHEEEEYDWSDKGLELLGMGNYEKALSFFKKPRFSVTITHGA